MEKSKNPTPAPTRRKGTAKPPRPKKAVVDDIGVYISLLTDFGFKRIFGTEANKDLLIDFLNAVLKVKGGIKDLQYANPERKGRIKTDRTPIFDLYCTTGKGERIIVEVQNESHKNFKERGVHSVSCSIQEQGKKGKEWKFDLCPVYLVNIVNFKLNKRQKTEKYASYIQLLDRDTHQLFSDKLTLVYLELPRFKKKEDELKNNVERWMYIFKHLHDLKNVPENLHSDVFQKLFEEAKIANMTPEEYDAYYKSLLISKQMNIVLDEYKEKVAVRDKTIAALRKRDAEKNNALAQKDNALAEKDKIIAEYQRKFGIISLN